MRSELAELAPANWVRRPIQDVCVRVTSGGTPSRSNPAFYEDGEWPWVKTQELLDRWIDDTEEHITERAIAESSAKVLPAQTILLALYGATVGQLGILRRPMACNQACCAIIVDPDEADYRYLFYLLIASRRQLKNLATGAAQQNLSGTLIKNFVLPFPKLAVQQRIANILGKLDDKIELNRRMNRTLEKMAAAIFKSWFIDFDPVHAKAEGRDANLPAEIANLFPDTFEDSALGPIPDGWAVSTLGDLIKLAYGKSLRAQDRRLGAVAVYGSNGQVGLHDTALATGPGIVVGRKGNPGIVTWAPTEFFPIDTTFYVVAVGAISSLYFLFHALKNHNLASLGADSAVPGLNRNMAYMSEQVVPTSELVQVFDSFAKPLRDGIHANELQNSRLASLRDTLLPKLLSGEIKLPEAKAIAEGVSA